MGGCCTKDESFRGFVVEDDGDHHQKQHERIHHHHRRRRQEEEDVRVGDGGALVRLQGSSKFTSMYTKQGQKGINQDAITVWENFAGEKDTFFCAVFDGHGPSGHEVAHHVRDNLPSKLFSTHSNIKNSSKSSPPTNNSNEHDENDDDNYYSCDDEDDDEDDEKENSSKKNDSPFYCSWKGSFMKSFKKMDEELSLDSSIDSYYSGTTAVAIVKQGDELIVANLGDSRAVLCTRRGTQRQLSPLQLTLDLKPNLPKESERIKKSKGRVFALQGEPNVYRVWMPEENSPGLAMARAFGDFCIKNYGLISTPHFSHRKLTDDDEFLVLATDGVWDVLTNDEVMKIVATAQGRSVAAKRLVESAARAWRTKHPTSRADDCAAICFFLKPPPQLQKTESAPVAEMNAVNQSEVGVESSIADDVESVNSKMAATAEWTALNDDDDGGSKANTLVNLPRFGRGANHRKTVKEFEDIGVQC